MIHKIQGNHDCGSGMCTARRSYNRKASTEAAVRSQQSHQVSPLYSLYNLFRLSGDSSGVPGNITSSARPGPRESFRGDNVGAIL
jgi:hypothetical protein